MHCTLLCFKCCGKYFAQFNKCSLIVVWFFKMVEPWYKMWMSFNLYSVSPRDLPKIQLNNHHATGLVDNRNAMAFVTSHPRIGVFFAEPETISVDHIRKYQQYMNDQSIKHAILVTRNALSSPARKVLNESKLHIEAFKENELVINITKHVLVPKHERISKNQTLFDANTTLHLPKLHRGDP